MSGLPVAPSAIKLDNQVIKALTPNFAPKNGQSWALLYISTYLTLTDGTPLQSSGMETARNLGMVINFVIASI